MDSLTVLLPAAYIAVLGVLSLFGLHRLHVLWLYRRHRGERPVASPLDTLPTVTVQLPVFNERAVVGRLVDAACRLDWPLDRLEIQILDDSTDDTVAQSRALAARWRTHGVDVRVLHRTDRTGYKAGALAAGLRECKGDVIAMFDADFVPEAGFLLRVVPHLMGDDGIGMVQARWGHLNENRNLLTRLSAVLLDGHFVLEHTARNRSGRFFNFNGTAGIWRRRCIEEAGGWAHDTLVEDLDLSYRAQLKGWRFVFLKDEVVDAELPSDIRGFKIQQRRWAEGTLQAARKLLPVVLRAPLRRAVKFEAMAHMLANLAYPLVVLLAVLMPPAILLRGTTSLWAFLFLDIPAFLLATASVATFYAVSQNEAHGQWRDKAWRLPLLMALGIGMSVSQSLAVFGGLFGNNLVFRRTPKSGTGAAPENVTRIYRPAVGWTPVVEVVLALWMFGGAGVALSMGQFGSLPFMLLFGFGFAYVGVTSFLPAPAPAPVEIPAPAPVEVPAPARSRVRATS
jgi:cellulose synthase/poly-beta-1,6-N-acetylglucosamine synthase-like glycosyltransferase